MGVGNEGTFWCLDQAAREYIRVVRVKQQVLVFFRSFFLFFLNRHRKRVFSAKRQEKGI